MLKDLVKVIQQESYTYRDPITEFLECLYVNFDFDGAQKKLRECEQVSLKSSILRNKVAAARLPHSKMQWNTNP